MSRPDLPGDPWRYTTWEGAERASLLAGARLTLREKLAWLEEAADLVEHLGSAAKGDGPAGSPRVGPVSPGVDLDRPRELLVAEDLARYGRADEKE